MIMLSSVREITCVVLVLLVTPRLTLAQKVEDWIAEKCFERKNTKHPYPGDCSKFIECNEAEHIADQDCSGTTYNWITKKCDNTTQCVVGENVHVKEWKNLDEQDKYRLRNGSQPFKPPLLKSNISNLMLKFDQQNDNTQLDTLLETHFLAVSDGIHHFTGTCRSWCSVWIQGINSCQLPQLVLRMKSDTWYQSIPYSYPADLKFGTFYRLKVAHVSGGQPRKLQIGVRWRDGEKVFNYTVIPEKLLRLNVADNCSKISTTVQPSPTTFLPTRILSPSTNIAHLSSTASVISKTMDLSSIGSPTTTGSSTITGRLSSSVSPSRTTHSSMTVQSSTAQSSEKALKTLVGKVINVTMNSSNPQEHWNASTIMRYVENNGESLAKKFNKKGEYKRYSCSNVVKMEVAYPISNYSFPRNSSLFQNDTILIPAHALTNNSGDFVRKVFSVWYSDLKSRFPRFFNAIETENNSQIVGQYELNSHVIASSPIPRIEGLKNYDIVIGLEHLETNLSPDVELLCAFYKWKNNYSEDGLWSTEGCIRDRMSTKNYSLCRCNHLTHFGILMQVAKQKEKISEADNLALSLITYIGCSLSLLGAGLTILAIACLPGARSDRNFIHVNLALAIAFAQITFLAGIDKTGNEIVCTIVASLLHYFLLAAFSWMLIEGLFLHILIVKVFHDHLPKKRYYVLFSWGVPAIIVLLSVNLLRDGYGTETSCWLSIDKLTIWTFSGPAIVVITINIIILCKVMKEISSLRTCGRRELTVRTVIDGFRSAIILLPLLGITWAFGLICVNGTPIIFQYLFAIFNSLQGLFIFLFHCVFNSEVRKAFWRKVDLWFTTHHNVFASNAQSPNSFAKSKDDHSSTSRTKKNKRNGSPKSGVSENSLNDETDNCPGRKISNFTTSSYMEPWSPRFFSESEHTIKAYPGRFSPTLASIDNIDYRLHEMFKEPEHDLKKTLSSPSLGQCKSTEDMNGNTHSLEDIRIRQKFSDERNDHCIDVSNWLTETRENVKELTKEESPKAKVYDKAIAIGIGSKQINCAAKKGDEVNRNLMRKINVSSKEELPDKKTLAKSTVRSDTKL